MQVTQLALDGCLMITPRVFADDRGEFFESFSEPRFREAGIAGNFVQDNQSRSGKGVIRGLHFQEPPYEQGKLVRVVRGAVLDVVVDIRKSSPTYGKSLSIVLDEKNRQILWIPPGFAHGFATLEENTIFLYKCTGLYHKASENGIIWNDSDLSIDWCVDNPVVSEKDRELLPFNALKSPF